MMLVLRLLWFSISMVVFCLVVKVWWVLYYWLVWVCLLLVSGWFSCYMFSVWFLFRGVVVVGGGRDRLGMCMVWYIRGDFRGLLFLVVIKLVGVWICLWLLLLLVWLW